MIVKFIEDTNLDGTTVYVGHLKTDSFNEAIDGTMKYYFEQCLHLKFNKKEIYKALTLHKAMLTPDDIQYLMYAVALAESKWGFKTLLQEKLLRLMEIMEND